MKRFNKALAIKITMAFSTMWAFYAFILYGLTPLMWPEYQDKILYWSNFIQLIALPALAVGAVVLGEGAERRDQETHDAVMAELELAKTERQEMTKLVKYLHEKLDGQDVSK